MIGQLHYFALLGLPVPGTNAKLLLWDNIFTHFEKEENNKNIRGKLEDDLIKIKHIMDNSTSNSLIIMNEIFSSTTIEDAIYLAKNIIEKILNLDALGIYVTFLDELTHMDPRIVSMVALVSSDDPSIRTFKISRKNADGYAYALSIAKKYCLTYNCLKERIKI
ncbi:MutS-related protein [Marinitoga lauensis]|uniref:MutS-related protein n=1 Tax=Marinitoga lauensis TaxID=2201189 RepID=UPI00197D4432